MSPADVSNTTLASMSLSSVTQIGASKLCVIPMCRGVEGRERLSNAWIISWLF